MGREKMSLPLGLSALDGMWGVASPLMTLLVKLRLSRKSPPGDSWKAEAWDGDGCITAMGLGGVSTRMPLGSRVYHRTTAP